MSQVSIARILREIWQNDISEGNKLVIQASQKRYMDACEPLVKEVDAVKAVKASYEESYTAYKAVLEAQSKISEEARDAYKAAYEAVKATAGEDDATNAGNKAYDEVMKKDKFGPDNYFTLMATNNAYEAYQIACDDAFLELYGA